MNQKIQKLCFATISLIAGTYVVKAQTTEPTFSYQINLIDENQQVIKTIIDDKEAYAGKSISYAYPKYITDENNGVTFVCKESTFSNTITVQEQGLKTVSYQKYEGVAYFLEAEQLNIGSEIQNNKNCSSGSAIKKIKDNSEIWSVNDNGLYNMTFAVCTGNVGTNSDGTKKKISLTVNQDDSQIAFIDDISWSINDVQKKGNIKTKNLTLAKGKSIKVTASPAKNGILDYILIEKIASKVSVSSAKYTTYVTVNDIVVPSEAKVYAVKVNENGTGIIKTEIPTGTIVPQGTGILVNAETGSYDFATTTETAQSIEDNQLQASDGVVSDGETYYALGLLNGKVGFALVAQGVEIPTGKAYLKVNKASGAKFINMDGELTTIKDIRDEDKVNNNSYYTLDGIKSEKPTKGIYIHNGKKVIIKQ